MPAKRLHGVPGVGDAAVREGNGDDRGVAIAGDLEANHAPSVGDRDRSLPKRTEAGDGAGCIEAMAGQDDVGGCGGARKRVLDRVLGDEHRRVAWADPSRPG